MENGLVVVERIIEKSTVTRCFSKYPLKLIVPNKVGSSKTDAVWIYSLSYGGSIVSGDTISCGLTVGDGCAAAWTTQASTKVYKAIGSKRSEQLLEASIGSNALLVVIPDPVTCFSTAKYSQKQVFRVVSDSSLIVADWLTCGCHENGEKWDFEFYKSTNHVFKEISLYFLIRYYWNKEALPLLRSVCKLPSHCNGHNYRVGLSFGSRCGGSDISNDDRISLPVSTSSFVLLGAAAWGAALSPITMGKRRIVM